jgi:hypothetical protein
MLVRFHRWSRRLLLGAAALPFCQGVGGCDPVSTVVQFGTNFVNITAVSLSQLAVASVTQTLLGMFPGSNLLRMLFLNSGFFPGL